jgi:hypothetical protein
VDPTIIRELNKDARSPGSAARIAGGAPGRTFVYLLVADRGQGPGTYAGNFDLPGVPRLRALFRRVHPVHLCGRGLGQIPESNGPCHGEKTRSLPASQVRTHLIN